MEYGVIMCCWTENFSENSEKMVQKFLSHFSKINTHTLDKDHLIHTRCIDTLDVLYALV